MTDYAAIYGEARADMVELGLSLSDVEVSLPCPACPGWTVKDVYAHVAGLASDLVAGNMAGAPGEEWTARQVDNRRGHSIDQILAEWAEAAPAVGEMLAVAGGGMSAAAIDLWTHNQDVRNAVGRAGNRGGEGLRVAAGAIRAAGAKVAAAGLPALRVRAGEWTFDVGEGEVVVRVTADAYEVARAALGRRSPDQMVAWDWSHDPAAYLPHLTVFGPRTSPLVE